MALESRGVFESVVREDHYHDGVGIVFDHLECADQRHRGARPGDDALLLIQAEAHVEGLFVRDLDERVVLVGQEELGQLELLERTDAGDVVPFRGMHGDHLDVRVPGLQVATVAGDRAAGAQASDEVGHLAFGLTPDLRAGRVDVGLEVGLILVLVGHVELGLVAELHGVVSE